MVDLFAFMQRTKGQELRQFFVCSLCDLMPVCITGEPWTECSAPSLGPTMCHSMSEEFFLLNEFKVLSKSRWAHRISCIVGCSLSHAFLANCQKHVVERKKKRLYKTRGDACGLSQGLNTQIYLFAGPYVPFARHQPWLSEGHRGLASCPPLTRICAELRPVQAWASEPKAEFKKIAPCRKHAPMVAYARILFLEVRGLRGTTGKDTRPSKFEQVPWLRCVWNATHYLSSSLGMPKCLCIRITCWMVSAGRPMATEPCVSTLSCLFTLNFRRS